MSPLTREEWSRNNNNVFWFSDYASVLLPTSRTENCLGHLCVWSIISPSMISSLPPFCLTQSGYSSHTGTLFSLCGSFGSECKNLSSCMPYILGFPHTQTPHKASPIIFPYERHMHRWMNLKSWQMTRRSSTLPFFFNFMKFFMFYYLSTQIKLGGTHF